MLKAKPAPADRNTTRRGWYGREQVLEKLSAVTLTKIAMKLTERLDRVERALVSLTDSEVAPLEQLISELPSGLFLDEEAEEHRITLRWPERHPDSWSAILTAGAPF